MKVILISKKKKRENKILAEKITFNLVTKELTKIYVEWDIFQLRINVLLLSGGQTMQLWHYF